MIILDGEDLSVLIEPTEGDSGAQLTIVDRPDWDSARSIALDQVSVPGVAESVVGAESFAPTTLQWVGSLTSDSRSTYLDACDILRGLVGRSIRAISDIDRTDREFHGAIVGVQIDPFGKTALAMNARVTITVALTSPFQYATPETTETATSFTLVVGTAPSTWKLTLATAGTVTATLKDSMGATIAALTWTATGSGNPLIIDQASGVITRNGANVLSGMSGEWFSLDPADDAATLVVTASAELTYQKAYR